MRDNRTRSCPVRESIKKDYSDIIDRSRPLSKHPAMSLHDRAAQFAPFAALTGHGSALAEVARITEKRQDLSDVDLALLNQSMALLRERLSEQPHVKALCFANDLAKEGGSYYECEGRVRTIDEVHRRLVFVDGERISLAEIVKLEIV